MKMSSESFLNWYVKPEYASRSRKTISVTINNVEKQKYLLAELLDKNQLYVHFSEMDDDRILRLVRKIKHLIESFIANKRFIKLQSVKRLKGESHEVKCIPLRRT